MKLRRSLLITPAHKEDLVAKIPKSDVDVAILELEDGVHELRKEEARDSAAAALSELDWQGKERIVRVNPVGSEYIQQDISALIPARPDGILLPKIKGPEDVLWAAEQLEIAEASAGHSDQTKLWCMIESLQGLANVEAIAQAHPRMTAVVFGWGDLGVALGVKRLGAGAVRSLPELAPEYIYARGRVVLAARLASIDAIDVANSAFRELEVARSAAEASAQGGFVGAIVFSPRQAEIINAAYMPSPEDLQWAEEVIRQYSEARRDQADNIVVVDGEMVDGPFIHNAQQILDRARLLSDRSTA